MTRNTKKAFLLIVGFALIFAFQLNNTFASEVTGSLCTGLNCPVEGTVISAPTASPVAGTYNSTQSVVLSSPGASWISYTTDGATSTCSNASTTGAISVTSSKTIKAISCYANNASSTVASFVYTLTCSTVSNAASYNAFPTCGPATCNSGYTVSGSSCVVSVVSSGGGGGGGDVVAPPAISQIVVTTLADNYAVISWQTNKPSLSWITYGTSTSYGLTSKTLVYVSSHSLKLTGLSASTVYHYQVKSQDTAGNIGSYTDKTFTTLSAGAAPVITTTVTTPTITQTSSAGLIAVQTQLLNTLILQLQVLLQQAKAAGVTLPAGTEQYLSTPSTGGKLSQAGNLTVGSVGEDVRTLQKFLNDKGFTVANSGPGSPGNETTRFGLLTKAALAKFQASVGISPASGFFGPITRAYLASIGY